MVELVRIHHLTMVVAATHRVLQNLLIKNLRRLLGHHLLFFVTDWTSWSFVCSLWILFIVEARCVSRSRRSSRLRVILLLVVHLYMRLHNNNRSHLWRYILISIPLEIWTLLRLFFNGLGLVNLIILEILLLFIINRHLSVYLSLFALRSYKLPLSRIIVNPTSLYLLVVSLMDHRIIVRVPFGTKTICRWAWLLIKSLVNLDTNIVLWSRKGHWVINHQNSVWGII